MAEYQGEYGHPYPRVDQYGNPVPPVDQYGNPGEPAAPPAGLDSTTTAAPFSAGGDSVPVHVAPPVEYGANAGYPHDGLAGSGDITAPPGPGGVAYPSGGVAVVAPAETTALAYEGMVGGGVVAAMAAGVGGGAHLQAPSGEEEHTFGPGAQLQPTKEEEHTTLGEKLRRSGSSSSSSSSEDDGQGGRRKKKSIKEKIKEKLPGSHKHEEQKAGHVAPAPATTTTTTGTHAAGTHEKKGFMEKIKEKLPGHHH